MFSPEVYNWLINNTDTMEYGLAAFALTLLAASVVVIKKGI